MDASALLTLAVLIGLRRRVRSRGHFLMDQTGRDPRCNPRLGNQSQRELID